MTTIASQITSLMVVYSIVYSGADQRKHQSYASLAFVRGIHRDRWIPRTKAINAENVSIWWRHHGGNKSSASLPFCEGYLLVTMQWFSGQRASNATNPPMSRRNHLILAIVAGDTRKNWQIDCEIKSFCRNILAFFSKPMGQNGKVLHSENCQLVWILIIIITAIILIFLMYAVH